MSDPVTGVSSRLNSATGTPLEASMGAKPAAGYTTEDVPTCPEHMSEVGESIIIITPSYITFFSPYCVQLSLIIVKVSVTANNQCTVHVHCMESIESRLPMHSCAHIYTQIHMYYVHMHKCTHIGHFKCGSQAPPSLDDGLYIHNIVRLMCS